MRNQNRIDSSLSPSAEKAARRRGRRKSPFSAATLAASLLVAWGILFAQPSFAQNGGGTVSNVQVTGTTASLQFTWDFTATTGGNANRGFGLCAIPAPENGSAPTLTGSTQCHGRTETFTDIGTTSGNIIDLPAGSYYPAVRAHDNGGETGPFVTPSPWMAIQVGDVVILPTVAKPSNLQATAGDGSINVTWDWTATEDSMMQLVQASEFELCPIVDSGSVPDAATLTTPDDCEVVIDPITYTPPAGNPGAPYDGEYNIEGLTNGTAYYIAVRAIGTTGTSQDSVWVVSSVAFTPAVALTPPTNVVATAGNRQIAVTWDWSGSETLQGFQVCAVENGGATAPVGITGCVLAPPAGASATSETITVRTNGITYRVWVRAQEQGTNEYSAWAGGVTATPAGICGGFSATVEGLCSLDNDDLSATFLLGYSLGNGSWFDYGQVFTAGSNADGYILSSIAVGVAVSGTPTGPVGVEIRDTNDDGDAPGSTILFDGFVAQPPTETGVVRFTPNSDFTLDPGTRYAVVIHARAPADDRDSGYSITRKISDNPDGTTEWAWGGAGSRIHENTGGPGSFEPIANFQLPVEIRAAVVGADTGLRLKLRVFLESALP